MDWKILRISLFLLAFFALSACVQPFEPVQDDVLNRKLGLDISVRCAKPETKADPVYRPGEERYNENSIRHIDWFIFVTNAGSATAVMHGRESWVDAATGETSKKDITELFLAKSLNMDNYIAANGRSGYVYVIANLPEEYSHDATAGIKRTEGGSTTTVGLTLSDLQAISFKTTFDLYHLNPADPSDYTDATFDPQESFIMDSQLLPFTLSETQPITRVDAWLTRVASKITLDIDLATAVDEIDANILHGRDTNHVSYLRTWYPDISKIQIYLSYANGASTLVGAPKAYNSAEFFTYNRYSFDASVTESTHTGAVNYYPTPINQDPNTPHTPAEIFYHKVEGTPFYSYPIQWTTSDTHAPFIKIIIPWTAYKETATTIPHNYLKHNEVAPGESPYTLGDTLATVTRNKTVLDNSDKGGTKEFFYKINLPTQDLKMLRNHWYKIKLDVGVLGSRDDDLSTTLSGKYYVVDWGDPDVASGGALLQGRYLGVADTLYVLDGSESLKIPVNSSHALSARITKRQALINGVWTTTAVSGRPANLTTRGTVEATGRSSVTFTDALNRAFNNQLDCYPMRFTVSIYHTDAPSYSAEVVFLQYPSIYIETLEGGNAMVDGYYGNVNNRRLYRNNYPNYARYHEGTLREEASGGTETGIYVPYGRITNRKSTGDQYANAYNLTIINISSFTEASKNYTISGNTREYLIADPRQPSGYSTANYTSGGQLANRPLVPYYKNGRNNEWGADAAKIMIGNRTTPNFIAPRLIVASRWGRMVNSNGAAENGYDAMERRCATYQEAGYPAGRWRLPTEAEVNFVAQLQRLHVIGDLFSGNGWVSNGTAVQIGTNSVTLITTGNTSRCVYDAWYWGDDPVPGASTVYTIGVE